MSNTDYNPNKKIVVLIAVLLLAGVIYLFLPSDRKAVNVNKTFQEKLEIAPGRVSANTLMNRKNTDVENDEPDNIDSNVEESPAADENIAENVPFTVIPERKRVPQKAFNSVLDDLKQISAESVYSVQSIIDKLNSVNGYPEGAVKAAVLPSDSMKSKVAGSYVVAYFDVGSGNIYIDQSLFKDNFDTKLLISILAHELDHFDKISKISASMGVEKFIATLKSEHVSPLDENFWRNTEKYTDISGFDYETYKDALTRLFEKVKNNGKSSYYRFWRISETIRNPLEVNAYKVSDAVENYYEISRNEGPLKKLALTFNELDWQIYNNVKRSPYFANERIAFFDYYFANAAVNVLPELQKDFDRCINDKDSDMTEFWDKFESMFPGFFKSGYRIDSQTYDTLMKILTLALEYSKKDITTDIAVQAMSREINTLKNNLENEDSVKRLVSYSEDFLRYINAYGTNDSKQELECILIILCAENNMYTKSGSRVSLYNMVVPDGLRKMYPVKNKKQKYFFIYNNEYFKTAAHNAGMTEQDYLVNLINKNRLKIK